jgi:hypothetical protein
MSELLTDDSILKRMAIKVKHGEYIEIFLRKGTLESNNHASYISLILFLNGKKYTINLNKEKAAHLSLILNQLVMEGNNIDYEVLRKIYPDQKSWHIY